MAHEPEINAFNVVLIGAFNPVIFTPNWLHANELISDGELQSANVTAILPELSNFRTKNFEFLVDRERFQISRLGPADITTFDLCMRLFGEFLVHTPLFQAGLNWEGHYKFESWEALHIVGDALAPKNAWGEWGNELIKEAVGKGHRKGGVLSLTMGQTVRDDGAKGAIKFTVEPSNRVQPGLFLRLNDHFEVNDPARTVGALPMIQTISDKFEASKIWNQKLTDTVLGIRKAKS